MASPIYSYQQVASTTSKLDQVVMLYDGAIKYLSLSIEDIKRKDFAAKAEHVDRSLAIVDYLRGILDMSHGGEVALHLDRLYAIVSRQIITASAMLDIKLAESAVLSLREIRSAWQQIAAAPAPCFIGEMPGKSGHIQTGSQSIRMTG